MARALPQRFMKGDLEPVPHGPPSTDSVDPARQHVLWDQDACESWHAALAAYPAAVTAYGGARLMALDRWYHDEWPAAVRARPRPSVSQEELLRVIRWKMGRGVWRERNLRLAEQNPEQEVVDRTGAALAAVPDPRAPVVEIARLRGVGPATASAVLAALQPAHYPFLDETVAAQVRGLGRPAFTVPYYLAYATALRARATALTARCAHEPWTAHAVDLALWTFAMTDTAAAMR
jgi:hypothetical protein